MTALQWALLLLGVGIAAALILSSLRERRAQQRLKAPPPQPASRDWSGASDILESPAIHRTAPRPRAGATPDDVPFDEFGVGRPRRKAPEVGVPEARPAAAAPSAPSAPALVIGFYIAEHEGTNILGPKIHAALQERGLRFGAKRVYHRYEGEQAVFSVASLVKPGVLDPAEAEGFATPGLSVFMQLPGPARPVAAFQDMLDTARGLARALNAELYDSQERAPLTADRARALHEQVDEWARRAGRPPGA